MMARIVTIEVGAKGEYFEVVCVDADTSDVLDEFKGGNGPDGSFIDPADSFARDFQEMRRQAMEVAEDMADDWNASVDERVLVYDASDNLVSEG